MFQIKHSIPDEIKHRHFNEIYGDMYIFVGLRILKLCQPAIFSTKQTNLIFLNTRRDNLE